MPRGRKSAASTSPSPSPKKPRFTLDPPARHQTNKRMSEAVKFNNMVFLAGQVAEDTSLDIKGQTKQVLASIDKLLAEHFTDKSKIIRADIFLKNLEDFAGMNEIWEPWIGPKRGPTRATVQANLMNPGWLIEVVVIAACCKDYPEEEEEEQEEAAADEKMGGEPAEGAKEDGEKAE